MSKALIPLSVVADNICSGMGDPTGSYKFVILRHLLSAYKKLHLFTDHEFEVKTLILDTDTNIIEMPCDFVYETKVAVMGEKNRCAILSLDRNMPSIDMTQQETSDYFDNIFSGNTVSGLIYPFYNSEITDLYGYGFNLNTRSGLYNVNRKDGTIELGSLFPEGTKLVVEYKSDGVSSGLTLVPTETEDVLSYRAKQYFYEERGDLRLAGWNKQEYLENYYQVKKLWNFVSALYIAETAYNYTSEI